MLQGIKTFQTGVKRSIEYGHRLNLALGGMNDVGVSVSFNPSRSIDAFRDAEAEYMKAQSAIAQMEAGIIDGPEARSILGHDVKQPSAGEFIASFTDGRYVRQPFEKKVWSGHTHEAKPLITLANQRDQSAYEYEFQLAHELQGCQDDGLERFWAWLLVNFSASWDEDQYLAACLPKLVECVEESIDRNIVNQLAHQHIANAWYDGKNDPRLFADTTQKHESIKPADAEAIGYLSGRVDPHLVESFLSRSSQRQMQLAGVLGALYAHIKRSEGSAVDDFTYKALLGQTLEHVTNRAAQQVAEGSIARARSWGGIYALREAHITDFKVDGPRDQLKCDYCWAMLDKVYSTETEWRYIQNIVESDNPDIMAEFHPVSQRFDGKDGLERLMGAGAKEIQLTGLASPPYHIFCRDYIIGVSRKL